MADDFKDHPQTIGEIRANRSHDAADWKPRDVLVAILRLIDDGTVDPKALVVAYRTEHEDGVATHWSAASRDIHVTLGLLSRAAHEVNVGARE